MISTTKLHYQRKDISTICDVELEFIAQSWSEQCKYNIFSHPIDDMQGGVFNTCLNGAKEFITKDIEYYICASFFTDNAAAIHFNENNLICTKGKIHNRPSAHSVVQLPGF